jgi:glycolate oxidase iron-sulfur subunit
MQTQLARSVKDTPEGQEAEAILRRCVHCGFCLATCPTYQLLGDELDSPRGRIYLIKQLLEGQSASPSTRLHLDRCLTCRACETTCPSGVEYGNLLSIGRAVSESRSRRPWADHLKRYLLRALLAHRRRFSLMLTLARVLRPLLPPDLARKIPRHSGPLPTPWPHARHPHRVVILEGCVQPALAPRINHATATVLDRVGISAVRVRQAGCCGALAHHLTAQREARAQARRNIDVWWPYIEAGAQGIVATASACSLMLKEYGTLLRADRRYAARAARVSELARDVSEIVAPFGPRLATLLEQAVEGHPAAPPVRVAFHAPCTLQHGLRIQGLVEPLLAAAGYALTAVPEAHLCCGSAGTYSLLQPALSASLLKRKIASLETGSPALIATANIGCLTQLASATEIPVLHWIELLAASTPALSGTPEQP